MSVLEGLNVSRETSQRLKTYAELLRKWNRRINLVSSSTIETLWERHFADSAQLLTLAPHPVETWLDLGSGGGFPGLVIAVVGMDRASPGKVVLVESDIRKAAFLRTVIRETGIRARLIGDRIENLPPQDADVVSARALAPLPTLLGYAEPHLRPDGVALFPKGQGWKSEVEEARLTWNFDYEVARSKTNEDAVILSVSGVSRV